MKVRLVCIVKVLYRFCVCVCVYVCVCVCVCVCLIYNMSYKLYVTNTYQVGELHNSRMIKEVLSCCLVVIIGVEHSNDV